MVEYGKEIAAFGKPSIYIKAVDERLTQLKKYQSSTAAEWKARFLWLNNPNIDTMAIDQAKRAYSAAWNLHRKVPHVAPPNFHKKSYEEKYQTCEHYNSTKVTVPTMLNGRCRFTQKHVNLPVLGKIRYIGSRHMLAKLLTMKEVRIGTITIFKDVCGEYYASFQLGSNSSFVGEKARTGSIIGIDLNVRNFYADSDGHIESNPHFFRNAKKHLAKHQRILSKRTARAKKENRSLKTSKNYQKQRIKVAKINKRIANCRRDFLHHQSMTLINNHDLIVAEDLRVKNILKNHSLAATIQDNGWRIFLNMLKYKAKTYNKKFTTVNPRNTTQTCSICGHTMKGWRKLTLKDEKWECPVCKAFHIRDVNAAINILNKGISA